MFVTIYSKDFYSKFRIRALFRAGGSWSHNAHMHREWRTAALECVPMVAISKSNTRRYSVFHFSSNTVPLIRPETDGLSALRDQVSAPDELAFLNAIQDYFSPVIISVCIEIYSNLSKIGMFSTPEPIYSVLL